MGPTSAPCSVSVPVPPNSEMWQIWAEDVGDAPWRCLSTTHLQAAQVTEIYCGLRQENCGYNCV